MYWSFYFPLVYFDEKNSNKISKKEYTCTLFLKKNQIAVVSSTLSPFEKIFIKTCLSSRQLINHYQIVFIRKIRIKYRCTESHYGKLFFSRSFNSHLFFFFLSDYFTSLEPREILLYRDVKDQSIRCKSRDIFCTHTVYNVNETDHTF